MIDAYDQDVLWIVIVGFLLAFVLAIALGANDVANAFGTTVGSGVLTLKQVYILGTIFETSGAIFLGDRVSDTIRKGIFDVNLYNQSEEILMLGEISALCSSIIWLFTATAASLPVSASHSVVGATLGFHLVVFGVTGVNWRTLITIGISWFLSPVLSGCISLVVMLVAKITIIDRKNTTRAGTIAIPFFYIVTIFINLFSLFYSGVFGLDDLELWLIFVISFSAGFLSGLFVYVFIIPRIVKQIKALSQSKTVPFTNFTPNNNISYINLAFKNGESRNTVACQADIDDIELTNSLSVKELDSKTLPEITERPKETQTESEDEENLDSPEEDSDSPEVAIMFKFLQIMTACFSSFAHGGNDVSNAISPLVAIWIIYTTGTAGGESSTPIWTLLYGGAGISLGLILLGRRVIKTVGTKLTKLTASSGFSVLFGSASTVLLASTFGIPISTTSCQVGSVIAIGWLRNKRGNVSWKLFFGIFSAWVITLPVTIGLSAGIMFCLQWIYI